MTCEIDRLINDYLDCSLTLEAIEYFSSDIQVLFEFIIQLKEVLRNVFNAEQPFLFSEMSFAIQSDSASPIPQLKVSSLGFLLPHFINGVKTIVGVTPFIMPTILPQTIMYSDITTRVEIYSFMMFLCKLLFQKIPPSLQEMSALNFVPTTDATNISPPTLFLEKLYKHRLTSFPKILQEMKQTPFFIQCFNFKHIQPEETTDVFSLFDKSTTRRVGKGSYGCVFSASHANNYYAIKEFSQEDVALKEVRTMCISRHPNIVTLFKFMKSKQSIKGTLNPSEMVEGDEFYYTVMECSAYGSLFDLIKQNEHGLSIDYIRHFMNDINNAMHYMVYTRQLVHRDLKTQNILVFQDATKPIGLTLKLCDFGSSRLIGDNSFDTIFVGSNHTNQPEISHGVIYDERCDLFSIGVVLYEMITCKVLVVPRSPNIPIENFYMFYQNAINDVVKERNTYVAGSELRFDVLLDLIRRLFVEEKNRMTWDQYFQHPFFTGL
ncbi:serine/threonine protein kinase 17A, putative [Entamoeba invadens IP1]|uniref:serine/threonine protein kinase 17A, putative n=1 Tax=Entamoeba invadens IP1 TaxID=370355 RepID=UPI0002C3F537|nr:serine/threonine protein kinase 17A, putative [Entamoeba invadens IP1]ELP93532.1 serine/threonine protein kinase 17A, putative [Entamoeba invadens IP1]|eukprot:XP_004260303.1 serine/threonine protein kinase 17A, putative [Entamoeba invadens IP1]